MSEDNNPDCYLNSLLEYFHIILKIISERFAHIKYLTYLCIMIRR
nr:MAG TPA: hypothetical protein [Crassvirales sp.]